MRISGKQAWAVMAGGIVAYEITCDEDQLLSVIVDEWLVTHPVITRLAIGTVALHLLNMLHPRVDVISPDFFLWRKVGELRRSAL